MAEEIEQIRKYLLGQGMDPDVSVDRLELHAMLDEIGDVIADHFKDLRARVAELEARAEKHVSYEGTWKSGVEYLPGNAVTDRGSLWIAKISTKSCRPGDNAFWKLAVKRGDAG